MGPSEKSALFGLTEPFEPLRLSGDGRKSMVETSPMPSFMRQPCTYAHPIIKKPVQPSHLQIPQSFNGGDTFPPVNSIILIAHIYLLSNLFPIHQASQFSPMLPARGQASPYPSPLYPPSLSGDSFGAAARTPYQKPLGGRDYGAPSSYMMNQASNYPYSRPPPPMHPPPPSLMGMGMGSPAHYPYEHSMGEPLPLSADGHIYQVHFKRAHRNFLLSPYAFKTSGGIIKPGDFVKVEADRGEGMLSMLQ